MSVISLSKNLQNWAGHRSDLISGIEWSALMHPASEEDLVQQHHHSPSWIPLSGRESERQGFDITQRHHAARSAYHASCLSWSHLGRQLKRHQPTLLRQWKTKDNIMLFRSVISLYKLKSRAGQDFRQLHHESPGSGGGPGTTSSLIWLFLLLLLKALAAVAGEVCRWCRDALCDSKNPVKWTATFLILPR